VAVTTTATLTEITHKWEAPLEEATLTMDHQWEVPTEVAMTAPLEETLILTNKINLPQMDLAILDLVTTIIQPVVRGLVGILDSARMLLPHQPIINPLVVLHPTTTTEEVAPPVVVLMLVCTDLAPTTTDQQTTTIIHHPVESVTMMTERETASTWIKETIRTEDTRQQMHLQAIINHVIVDITAK
jgi:hypothetical protein